MLYNKVETIAENDKNQTYEWKERSRAQWKYSKDFLWKVIEPNKKKGSTPPR
jgi:hypothetical protein